MPIFVAVSKTINFADDKTVFVDDESIDEMQVLVAGVVNNMERWCDSSNVILNSEKTMRCWFFKNSVPIVTQGFLSECARFLGLQVDQRLF